MCQSRNSTIITGLNDFGNPAKVDKCLTHKIESLIRKGIKTLGSCCGHDIYSPTIIVKDKKGNNVEYFTKTIIPRKRRFYLTDEGGFYYIPELEAPR